MSPTFTLTETNGQKACYAIQNQEEAPTPADQTQPAEHRTIEPL